MIRPLNDSGPPSTSPEPDPAGLSQRILAEARRVERPEQCGTLTELTGLLCRVDPAAIEGDGARLAFWINLYNALLLHRLCLRPIRGSVLWQLRLFSTVAYEVGGNPYSLNLIEHGVLRRNARPPYRLRRPLRPGDPRALAAPARLNPRLHFALNCGARSCPPIHVYEPDSIDEQLELATRAYLRAETSVDNERGRVTLPRLMRLYRADFGDRAAQLDLAARHVAVVRERREASAERLRVRYGRFDWTAAPSAPRATG
ncbi:MAG: DUF547 domain-containing protein [Solirubrobacterales bacterium]